MIKEIREELDQLGEESYKQFNQKLIPGTDHVIGVRMPALRKLAKGIAKTDSKQYLEEALLWSSIFVTLMANKIGGLQFGIYRLSLIHISEPTRPY